LEADSVDQYRWRLGSVAVEPINGLLELKNDFEEF
jgi:hypothetical protein